MTIVVFLGPTLSAERARSVLDASYRAPARMGDIYRAAQERPDAIALVDGVFENTAAVWHKEILFALSQGIPVYGAASMGALRAAELHAFGMHGVGDIFDAYASGAIEDDDEVAVVHAPAGDDLGDALSEAMINLRAGLATACARGLLAPSSCAALTAVAKAMFYAERSWSAVFAACTGCGVPVTEAQALRAFVDNERPNQKRDDALALLTLLAGTPPVPAAVPDWTFEHTVYWDSVCTYYGMHAGSAGTSVQGLSFERLRNHARLASPQRTELRRHALLLGILEAETRRLRVGVADMRGALQQFRYRRGLQDSAALRTWMTAHGVDQARCLELARLEALEAALEQRYAERGDHYFERALQLSGAYPALLDGARRKWDGLGTLAQGELTADDVDSVDAVLAWYEGRHGRIGIGLEQHAADLGFRNKREFLHELFAGYLAEQRGNVAATHVEEVV